MMKYAMKLGKLIRGSKGQATISAAMILLLIGGILVPPCLGFAVVSLKASQSGEQVLEGRYAADAGVMKAINQINQSNTSVPDFSLNNRTVNVTIEDISGGGYSGYKIISTATGDTGGNTTIECYYGALDYSSLLANAITSNDTLKIQPGNNITGNISAPDCGDVCTPGSCPGCPNWTCCVDCLNCTNCCSEEPLGWPTAETLSEYYLVETPDSYPTTIDVKDTPSIGPLYREGDLNIDNTGSAGAVFNLTGTIYVTGNFECKEAGAKNYTINLNNQTIYCEGDISVSKSCTISGSGCIIAVGEVYFTPQGDVGSPDNFVLIMSVEDTVTLQPTGDFYGAVAGNAEVNLQPGNTLYWTGYGEGVDFPIGQGVRKVLSYTIK